MSGNDIQLRYIRRNSDRPTDVEEVYENAGFQGDDGNIVDSSNWILKEKPYDGQTLEVDMGEPNGGQVLRKRKEAKEDGSDDEEEEDGDDGDDDAEYENDDDDGDDDDDTYDNCFLRTVKSAQSGMNDFSAKHGSKVKHAVIALFIAAYSAYFAYALYYSFEGEDAIRLLWVTCLAAFLCFVVLIRDNFGETIYRVALEPPKNFIEERSTVFKWLFILAAVAAQITFIVVEVAIDNSRNLQSLIGLFLYVFLFFVFSLNPAKVRWRPVLWGLGLQFWFAVIILRTSWGFEAFKWLGDRVQEFMTHTDAGSIFVFGENLEDHFFAFKVMPNVVFFSTAISVLYYLGWMQVVITKIAWLMKVTMGTTAAESMNAAGNIFIGQTEAPLLIRPFIKKMTPSEVHAVMTGGYATIAGSVMATYIILGVPANHLITASVMAAPCALGMSKLSCPETNRSKTTDNDISSMEKSKEQNVIEAASAGASASIALVANIVANLIAFIALLEFVNATLEWFGNRVGLMPPEHQPLTFQFICSYVLWPFAFALGVDSVDCRKVAELIGFKTFINEFVAYTELGVLISNRETFDAYPNDNWVEVNDNIYLPDTNTTLVGGVISERSVVISTYALCGFANFSSIGMVIGALSSIAPKKRKIIASLALRAMLTGNIVSFLNACTAGLLYQES